MEKPSDTIGRREENFWFGLWRRRIVASGQHSLAGLTSCFKHEEAFRIEVILTIFLIPIACWLAENAIEGLLMIAGVILVLIAELLNSAVEAAVDRVGPEYHSLAKRAKDTGSAAVFMSMLLVVVIWLTILIF